MQNPLPVRQADRTVLLLAATLAGETTCEAFAGMTKPEGTRFDPDQMFPAIERLD